MKEIDENLQKTIAKSNERKHQVNELFYKAVRSADKERIFTFKIKDFAEEYERLTGIKVCAQLQSTGGYCCKGHVATKEELLEKCGDEKVAYFLKFSGGEFGCKLDRALYVYFKMTDVLMEGKRWINEAEMQHWSSGTEEITYLELPEYDESETEQLLVSISPFDFIKNENEERINTNEKAFEAAVVYASMKNLFAGTGVSKDDTYKFKVCDLVDEYKKISGTTLSPLVVAYRAPVCKYEGTIPAKETLLENFGDANLEYFVQFFDKDKTIHGAICSFKCKLNHVFQNGKRLVDEVKFEPSKSRFAQQVCIQAQGFDDNLLCNEVLEIQPFYHLAEINGCENFENAVCKAILKHQALENNNLETHNIGNNTPKQNTIENGKGKE